MALFSNNAPEVGKHAARSRPGRVLVRTLAVIALSCGFVASTAHARHCSDYFSCTLDRFAGEQFVIEIEVGLEDRSTNTPDAQFANSANRDVGTFEVATS